MSRPAKSSCYAVDGHARTAPFSLQKYFAKGMLTGAIKG